MLNLLEAFSLAFAACVSTNIDNVLLVLAVGKRSNARGSAAVFFAVLAAVVVLSLGLSRGADLLLPRSMGWLGLVPLGMGLFELRPGRGKESRQRSDLPLAGIAALLAANSFDTLIVQTILFTDSATPYDLVSLVGALTAALVMSAAAFVLISHRGIADRLMPAAARLRPLLLIVIGAMIMMDTGFDIQ